MWLAQNLKMPYPKNRKSKEAVFLTVCSTHEYYKLWEWQPPRAFGSWEMTLFNLERVTLFFSHPLNIISKMIRRVGEQRLCKWDHMYYCWGCAPNNGHLLNNSHMSGAHYWQCHRGQGCMGLTWNDEIVTPIYWITYICLLYTSDAADE